MSTLLHTIVWTLVWAGWSVIAWGIVGRPLNWAGARVGWWSARRAQQRAERRRILADLQQVNRCRAPMPELADLPAIWREATPAGRAILHHQLAVHYQSVASLSGAGAITARPVVCDESWVDFYGPGGDQ